MLYFTRLYFAWLYFSWLCFSGLHFFWLHFSWFFTVLFCPVLYFTSVHWFLLGGEVSQKIDRFAAAGMLASQMEINRGSAVHTQPHCVLLHAVLSWVRSIWACFQCILGCSVFWPAVYFGLHSCSLGWGLFEPAYNAFWVAVLFLSCSVFLSWSVHI